MKIINRSKRSSGTDAGTDKRKKRMDSQRKTKINLTKQRTGEKKEERQAQEFDRPVDREEFIRRRQLILDVMREKAYVPMKIKELAILLDIPRDKRGELARVV